MKIPKPIPSATPAAITPTINTLLLHPDPPTSSSNGIHTTIEILKQTTHTFIHPRSSKIHRAISRLLPHSRPGLKERHNLHTTRPAREGGRWRSHCPNAKDKIIITLTGLAVRLADKNMSMSGPVYTHASIATPGLAVNHHTGNGLDHLHIMERPDAHIMFPSSCLFSSRFLDYTL